MLELENHLTINKETILSPNLCHHFSADDLSKIGNAVYEGYEADKYSRTAWERRTEAAMELALQIQKGKNFPWPDCSNVSFPLLTVATLQFHARAYPAIISGSKVVKCRVIGDDPDGLKSQRANRISTHMSYQVLEQDTSWEEQHDRLLINLAVVGTAFIKTFHDSTKGHNISELVLARDLVINYWSKSVEESPRKTQIILLSRNDIHKRVLMGSFRDILDEPWYSGISTLSPTSGTLDANRGMTTPPTDRTTPLTCLEQHCSLDLDGDGYAEPYIITIDQDSRQPLRIVTRFDREEDVKRVPSGKRKGQIIEIIPMEYYTKYGFIPAPDGGIYDIGFGTLTGPLNESVNSLVNQLIDAGTMANGGGGFLGRGAKIRGGAYTFAPFEWKRVDSTTDDLAKSIYPLPVREPSGVLLQLLSLIINYTNRISGATDMMVGENPGQNTPAYNARTMVEQGTKIYTAIFKRVWRSMREEFKKLYTLNAIFMEPQENFGSAGSFALKEDYLGDPSAVIPVADPNITSDEQRMQQAITLKQAAAGTPGYDTAAVEVRFLEALHVDGIPLVYPGPGKIPPGPDAKVQIEQMKAQTKIQMDKSETLRFLATLEEEKRLNNARIFELQAKAAKEIVESGSINATMELEQNAATMEAIQQSEEQQSENMEQLEQSLAPQQPQGPEASAQGQGSLLESLMPESEPEQQIEEPQEPQEPQP